MPNYIFLSFNLLGFLYFKVVDNISKIQELWRSTTAPKEYVEKMIPLGIRVSILCYSSFICYIVRIPVDSKLTVPS